MRWYFCEVESSEEAGLQIIESSADYTQSGNFPLHITDAAGNTTAYDYDEDSGHLDSVTDPAGNTTAYTYENNSNRISTVSAGGSSVGYTYDSGDRLSSISQNDTEKYHFTYDDLGRVSEISVVTPNGYQPLMTTSYDQYSRPDVKTYGNGQYFTTTYDTLDNITEIKYNNDNSKKICYYYSADNVLSKVVDYFEGTTTCYTYDLCGRTVAVRTYSTTDGIIYWSQLARSVGYTYADKTNYLTGVSFYSPLLGTEQDMTYTYGDITHGELPDSVYSVSVNGDRVQSYSYDGLNRVIDKDTVLSGSVTLPNHYIYDDIEGTNKTTTNVKAFINSFGTYVYTYDERGYITYEEFQCDNYDLNLIDFAYRRYYEYDELGQLVMYSDSSDYETVFYYYDGCGNLTGTQRFEVEVNCHAEPEDFIEGELYPTGNKSYTYSGDKLISYNGGNSNTYDAIGNPLSYSNGSQFTFTWANGRQLATALKDGMLYSFGYNADGMRISKTVSDTQSVNGDSETTYFVYNGSTLMGLRTGSNVMTFIHGADGEYLGFDYNGTKYYYVKNVQGDVVGLTDASGNIIAYYVYDAWGKPCYTRCLPANRTIADLNPIRYRGYYYDTDLGMYYLQSRYYDPKTGRFINADGYVSTGQGVLGYNMFAYCNNNPVMHADPSGHSMIAIISIGVLLVGIAVCFTSSTPTNSSANNSIYYSTNKDPIDPNIQPNPESGYVPPKNDPNPSKVKNPNGKGRGWPANNGGVWVPNNRQDGGPGWTVQFPDGGHEHRYPDGHVRSHKFTNANGNITDVLIGGLIVLGTSIGIIIIIADDATGVGVIDDLILPPFFGVFARGVQIVCG